MESLNTAKKKTGGKNNSPVVTKLGAILRDRNISYSELQKMISVKNDGYKMDIPFISRIVTGKKINLNIITYQRIARALDLTIDQILAAATEKIS